MKVQGLELVANVSLLFGELPYRERFAAARAAGFDLVESWWPFAEPDPGPAAVDDLVGLVESAGVGLRGLNVFGGDLAAGERGLTCLPHRRAALEANLPVVAAIAARTGCRRFNLLYGRPAGLAPQVHRAAAVAGYTAAAEVLGEVDGIVLVEPMARDLVPDYPLRTAAAVVELLDALPDRARARTALLFDTFHLGANGVDLVQAARRYAGRVGHVQLADSPDRGEPGSGVLPIGPALAALVEHGYRGLVAAEYAPTGATLDGLDWIGRL